MDFEHWAHAIHVWAKSKGWWDLPEGVVERDYFEQVANYHGEISEAWEEYRKGLMTIYYVGDSLKPEGFWVEIADLAIRLLDSVSYYKLPLGQSSDEEIKLLGDPADPPDMPPAIPRMIVRLHTAVSSLQIANGLYRRLLHLLLMYSRPAGVDLEKLIELKMGYNQTRPYRHGNKLA